MVYFSLFFTELLLLFFLSRNLTRILSHFFYHITKSEKITIYFIAILFFPGTLLHECAHALCALFLGVQVRGMEFVPQMKDQIVKLGSVQIVQTDPIRRFFIGAAPFFLGTVVLLGILFFATHHEFLHNSFFTILVGYLVFEIGNTMFSSRKDMEGALELFLVIIFLLIIGYLLGIRTPSFNPNSILSQPVIQEVFERGSLFLLVPLLIDGVIILCFLTFDICVS